MITFYSTNCPKCQVLAKKLDRQGIPYNIVTDINIMLTKGIKSAPYLEMEDGTLLDFMQANNWLKDFNYVR